MKSQWFTPVMLSVLFSASLAAAVPAYAHDGAGKDGGDKSCHHIQLSDQKKQLLHQTMKTSMEKDKPLIEKEHDLHKQMHAILAADNFDAKAFESVSARIEQTHDKIHQDRVKAFASIAPQFTPEEREAIIHWQSHHHGHHHGHHDGKGHEGQPMAWKHGQDRGPDSANGKEWLSRDQSMTPPTDTSDTAAQPVDTAYPPYPNR